MRVVALACLAVLVWRLWPRAEPPRVADAKAHLVVIDSVPAVASLVGIALRVDGALHTLSFSRIPDGGARGMLDALIAAGIDANWTDESRARGLAVSAMPLADPAGAIAVSATGGDSASIVVRDAAGILDSARHPTLLLRNVSGAPSASLSGSVATASSGGAVVIKRVLVYGRPGWESKFVIASLEEAGWSVDGRFPVSPRVSVTIGEPRALDTSRYGAAIVLDTALASASTLQQFVRSGGGVVLAGDAMADARLAAVAAASANGSRGAIAGGLASDAPLSGLEAYRLAPRSDAVVVKRDVDGTPVIVVKRLSSGRVLASAYRETWRWRMEGAADAEVAHRQFWTALVRAVAYAPERPAASARDDSASMPGRRLSATAFPGDPAPYADLVARLGSPVPRPASVATQGGDGQRGEWPSSPVLVLMAMTALVAEWGSRRTRGVR